MKKHPYSLPGIRRAKDSEEVCRSCEYISLTKYGEYCLKSKPTLQVCPDRNTCDLHVAKELQLNFVAEP